MGSTPVYQKEIQLQSGGKILIKTNIGYLSKDTTTRDITSTVTDQR